MSYMLARRIGVIRKRGGRRATRCRTRMWLATSWRRELVPSLAANVWIQVEESTRWGPFPQSGLHSQYPKVAGAFRGQAIWIHLTSTYRGLMPYTTIQYTNSSQTFNDIESTSLTPEISFKVNVPKSLEIQTSIFHFSQIHSSFPLLVAGCQKHQPQSSQPFQMIKQYQSKLSL